MDFILSLLVKTIGQVGHTLLNNWPYLLASAAIAACLQLYIDSNRVSAFLLRYRQAGVLGATAAAVGTPLCSCGTTAVILGMMANLMPWGPIVAFMVASPLTSPQELVYSAGLFGWPFALAFFLASIVLGLAGGVIASLAEGAGWLHGQTRLSASGSASNQNRPSSRFNGRVFLKETVHIGQRLLVMFLGFAFLGYFLNGLIPSAWVSAIFGKGSLFSIPLAATLGLPLYLNTEASLPLVRTMLDAGMSQGAALAFMISGAGTSLGAIAGVLTIARWRVVGLVVGTLWAGAIACGFAYSFFAAAL
ncbi:MAG TPA: permease [Anaerolineales bacterium]|nr:permease [Anaerolineales bacterium]